MDNAPDEPSGRPRRWGRAVGYTVTWLVAAGLAVTVGVVAVTSVGASIRGRGPLGNEAIRTAELNDDGSPDPGAPVVRRTLTEEAGSFVVECQDTVASGISITAVDGWRTVSYDEGPDDDVDAVWARADRSIEIEVFCNSGEPTVAEVERKTLPEASR